MTAMAWAMAAVLAIVTLFTAEVGGGDAGRNLARIFAAALAVAGLALFGLGVSILGDDRNRTDHYVTPMIIGAAAGVLEISLFFWQPTVLLALPPLLLVFALRPVRRGLSSLFGAGR